MYERFLEAFTVTQVTVPDNPILASTPSLASLFDLIGGATVQGGLYRVHTAESAATADGFVNAAFDEFGGLVSCFGFDWLGRQFAADLRGPNRDDPPVLMLEPGSGEVLEIPSPVSRFHDYELIESTEAALAASFHQDWARENPALIPLGFSDCVGYVVRLFLGGSDTIDNLAVTDIAVYWTIMGQLRSQTRGLSRGTAIGSVERSD